MFDRHARVTSPCCRVAARPSSGQISTPPRISARDTVRAARRALREGLTGTAVVGEYQVDLRSVCSGHTGEVLALAPPGVALRPPAGCTDIPGDLRMTWQRDARTGEIWLAGWWRQIDPTTLPTALAGSGRAGASEVLALEVVEGLIRMSQPGSRSAAVPLDDESVWSLTGPGPG